MYDTLSIYFYEVGGTSLCRSSNKEHTIKKGTEVIAVQLRVNKGARAFYCLEHASL